MGFERDGPAKRHWVGSALPEDPAAAVYGPLVGCVLSRLGILLSSAAPQNQVVEMQRLASEFVDAWWESVEGHAIDSESWVSQFHASLDDRFVEGEPSVDIMEIAVKYHSLGGITRELWVFAATAVSERTFVDPITSRWKDARFPGPLTRAEARAVQRKEVLPVSEEYLLVMDALPVNRVLNEQFDTDVQQVLAGVGARELRVSAEKSADRLLAMSERAASINFPGADRSFDEVLAALSQIDG